LNYYPRHIGDWMRDTAHLSEIEECIYSRLIDTYYSREKPLPADEAQCCRLVRASSKQAKAAVQCVLREFFALEADGWHQKRCDEELARHAEKSAKAAASASARWCERNANAMRTHSEGNASQEPIANSQEPKEVQEQKPRVPRATRLAPDWELPAEWGDWAANERGWSASEVVRVSHAFADHWRSKGEPRADWLATWRNWVRRERAQPVQTKLDARAAVLAGHFKDHDDGPRDITGEAQRVA
jgi:uncharacterized protein YdaU (DUF1376 family)